MHLTHTYVQIAFVIDVRLLALYIFLFILCSRWHLGMQDLRSSHETEDVTSNKFISKYMHTNDTFEIMRTAVSVRDLLPEDVS